MDLFDAIEFSSFYADKFTNRYNMKAIKIAKKYNKPIVGTSDVHRFYQFNKTFTLIEARENEDNVFEAIREGKSKIITSPLSYYDFIRHLKFLGLNYIKKRLNHKNNKKL